MRFVLFMGLCLLPGLALAHPGHGDQGWLAGLIHPFSGWDHCLTMLSIGLWSAVLPARTRAGLFAIVLLGMLSGAGWGMQFIVPPQLETLLTASTVAVSLLLVIALRIPLLARLGFTFLVAILHGIAHGAALPQQAHVFSYATGFLLATLVLLMLGWWLGHQAAAKRHRLGWLLVLLASGFAIS